MKLQFRELRFLIFFIPIYFCKLLDITASHKWFILLSMACFLSLIFSFYKERVGKKKLIVIMVLVAYTGLMVITSSKQGPFFSAMIIMALYGIDDKRKIFKILFWVGIIAVLVSCYLERNGTEAIRYINGEWTGIFKRSNILYISFLAVITFYLFIAKEKALKISNLLVIFVVGYGMYKYSGARTGLVILVLLELMLFAFRYKWIQKNGIVKKLCVFSPIVMMVLSCVLAWGYSKSEIFTIVDSMLQGRIRLGVLYFARYHISVFGQKLYQNLTGVDFWNLDCAYYYMLLGYGLIFTIFWLWISCKLIKYLYDSKRFVEVSIMVIYATYGITETFLPNGFLNISIFLYAEYLYQSFDKHKRKSVNYDSLNYCDGTAKISIPKLFIIH